MTDSVSRLRATAHPLNTTGVTVTRPTKVCRPEKCEFPLHIGLFFDGTNNNQDWADPAGNGQTHLERQKDSNVARLFRAYREDHLNGYYRVYVPGVGTPFRDIGEDDANDTMGLGFGAGGDARIVFGLLSVLNTMHSSIDKNHLSKIKPEAIRALCRNGKVAPYAALGQPSAPPPSASDRFALSSVGMEKAGGLLTYNGDGQRTEFLKKQFAQLAQKIKDTDHPKLVEVFIDVFGFSRGAAEARVFCNWLDECFSGDTLAGVSAHIRFLGIFDTVAAVGFGPAVSRYANGHSDWGDAENLKICARVQHCEHYVAMHEQRQSFPLEDVHAPGESMPPRCRQFRFPGMHSDLGGAYTPSEQGKGPSGSDEDKLSQLPLNRMLEAALAAHVPLNSKLAFAPGRKWDPFAIGKAVQSAYDAFIKENGAGEREITDCLIDILAWRYKYRNLDQYRAIPGVARAAVPERNDLCSTQKIFLSDIDAIHNIDQAVSDARTNVAAVKALGFLGVMLLPAVEEQLIAARLRRVQITDQQREILGKLQRPVPAATSTLFAEYCHDSYAGFKPYASKALAGMSRNAPWEDPGYLRYRTRYAGADLRLTQIDLPDTDSVAA